MYLPYSTVKEKLFGKYQVFDAHKNLSLLKKAKRACLTKRRKENIIHVDETMHYFHEKTMYQFHEDRELTLTLFNYRYMPAVEDDKLCALRWVYVQTPLATHLIARKGVVAVFKNGFNLFGFNLPNTVHDVEEAFLMNPIVQEYVIGV